ncbi:MAG: PAS domain-containing protein [Vulcanimicrobiota bacterium]
MGAPAFAPTGLERHFGQEEIIVSKTDLKGRITYANRVFLRIAGYSEGEVIGQPHNMIRHPDMPRSVFRLLWDTMAAGREIFAFVKNMCKGGDHYWVLAHVTPTFDGDGRIMGYHSNRRWPERAALAAIEPLYAQLLLEEARHSNPKQAAAAGVEALQKLLVAKNTSYDEFIFSLVSKEA